VWVKPPELATLTTYPFNHSHHPRNNKEAQAAIFTRNEPLVWSRAAPFFQSMLEKANPIIKEKAITLRLWRRLCHVEEGESTMQRSEQRVRKNG
jgi:hypothetical protein